MKFLGFMTYTFYLVMLTGIFFTHVAKAEAKSTVCLATAIYHESRGEPMQGQVAVAHVVLNRTGARDYPKDICGVIYQKQQFTDIEKIKPDLASNQWTNALKIAILSRLGVLKDPTNGSKWYYAQGKVFPRWAKGKKVAALIGGHTFLNKV